ncbi:MAG: hypothetical protein IPG34_17230 [Rhodocyclaceae bacterium]|nr:hypothetical protein [Rhodocyclaceae bacterium]
MAVFLFLEIHDLPVVALLQQLRKTFKGHPSNSPIHITIRGPYLKMPDRIDIGNLWDAIRAHGILVNRVAHFELNDRRVIYLRATSDVIRELWHKPDYPIHAFGFNPHITLYEGPVKRAADVERFLRVERLEFLCTELSLRFRDTEQGDFLTTATANPGSPQDSNSVLMSRYRWKDGIEHRAFRLVKEWAQ